jgi:hypothetical protein
MVSIFYCATSTADAQPRTLGVGGQNPHEEMRRRSVKRRRLKKLWDS